MKHIGRRVAKVMAWGLMLCLSILSGGLWFAYTYVTDSETAARLIKNYVARYLPGSNIDPGRVRLRPFAGELTLNNFQVYQRNTLFPTVRVPWLKIAVNPRKLLRGQMELRQISVVQPSLRLFRRRDGTFNLQGFLADPWPGPYLENTPPIVIEHGTLAVVPDEEDPASAASPGLGSSPGATESGSERDSAETPPSPPRPVPGPGIMVLRDMSLKIEQVAGMLFRFEGTAQGDSLERLQVSGSVDLETGRTALNGKLTGLTLSDGLRRRMPRELRPAMKDLGLTGGVVDVELKRSVFDPKALPGKQLHYAMGAWLRDGTWECLKLPFPVNKVSSLISVEDGRVTIERAEGFNGRTTLRARGVMDVGDPRRAPMDLHVEVVDLELDWRPNSRLRSRTPPEFDELWDVFQPSGMVDASVDLTRSVPGGPIELATKVTCKDIAANYRHFAYPIDHVRGQLELKDKLLTVDVQTLSIGGRPLRLKGTINNPGVDAVVALELWAESVPIDEPLLKAFKPEVRKVVNQFSPRGTVRAHARISRRPIAGRPEGLIGIDAEIDASEQCEITWDKLPYPIRNLTGRLELHPDHWVFRNVRGRNGEAKIVASGEVIKLSDERLPNGDFPLKVHVDLQANNLPFSQELRKALPGEWEMSWRTINPSGSCDIESASVDVEYGHPDRTHIVVVPRPESNVRLVFTRAPQPGIDPGGVVELRLDDVSGRFVFDNGTVVMNDVGVQFRGSPVRFDRGKVFVGDTGRFDLSINDLWVQDIRIDRELRNKMPPLMAAFAKKLDEQRTFTAHGNLKIGWSGLLNETAWCQWDNTLVVLNDNTLKTGIPLEHIQGQLDHVSGWSNGLGVRVEGIMSLESVVVLGQQFTKIESPFRVHDGVAELVDLRGRFLGGDLWGKGWVSLDATPSYYATMTLHGAQLEEYARTLGGRQAYRGNIEAQLECSGLGSDLRTLQGHGEAHITHGDLGTLPVVFRIASLLNPTRTLSDAPKAKIKTAFDSADVSFTIAHGLSTLDPIKFTGNAFSLQGRGTLDPQGNLDLRLPVLLGRDRFHIRGLSDLAREAGGQILSVRVTGTLSDLNYDVDVLPQLKREVSRVVPIDR
ncbi:MAG: AsmA-like C-terminal region-containing protein [Isosphaeraceae bacterium]